MADPCDLFACYSTPFPVSCRRRYSVDITSPLALVRGQDSPRNDDDRILVPPPFRRRNRRRRELSFSQPIPVGSPHFFWETRRREPSPLSDCFNNVLSSITCSGLSLNDLLSHKKSKESQIEVNMRVAQLNSLAVQCQGRNANVVDLFQLATRPPTHSMTVFHPSLPFDIPIISSFENGLTVWDVISQIHTFISTRLTSGDYWSPQLNAKKRESIQLASAARCVGEGPGRALPPYCWVDFLGFDVIFTGLVKKDGKWMMKMKPIAGQKFTTNDMINHSNAYFY